ncbi:M1 family aminopeptidase [Flavihumibacter cheonanensis]|uniref:ABC transporter permease/M1 family aminopeptidase n=1 Tax=Flavihumibacter cheonanensis TaxID=1442385 RepID=UPI001EF82593|nr:M1 family aminopeptidase [Flavihumibacter cheonanensis]MCG7751331.1 hypothetical protein [Flavihumibacter cheonanensis]
MRSVLLFDIHSSIRNYVSYLVLLLCAAMGLYAGSNFNISVGEGIYLNSPFSIGYITGFLSLAVIFIASIIGSQLLFKEWDARMDSLVFTTPLSKTAFLTGRALSYVLVVLFIFLSLYTGFVIGQSNRTGSEIQPGLYLVRYLYAFMVLVLPSLLFVCSFLLFVAMRSKRKLLLVISGLLVYVLYMVVLVYSNSPFMNATSPQSVAAQKLAALLDPFGLSAYYYAARDFSVNQRNQELVPLTGFFLLNRLLYSALAVVFIYFSYLSFSVTQGKKSRAGKSTAVHSENKPIGFSPVLTAQVKFKLPQQLKAIYSFVKLDLVYVFKSVVLPASGLLLVFAVGMEMIGEIEKGIRMPQRYASSGLLAGVINENFQVLGLFLITYFINDLYWRSAAFRFNLVEGSTGFAHTKVVAHAFSISALILFYSLLLIGEGLLFQLAYQYTIVDAGAYLGVLIFNSLPLVLLSCLLLLINFILPHKYIALGLSFLFALLLASPLALNLFKHPLALLLTGYSATWTDFSGYGGYLGTFLQKVMIGVGVVAILWMLVRVVISKKRRILLGILPIAILLAFAIPNYIEGYKNLDKQEQQQKAVNYEKGYRRFQELPQPTIQHVTTKIDLYPEKRCYQIEGTYLLRNTTSLEMPTVLVNFPDGLKLESAALSYGEELVSIQEEVQAIRLKKVIQPGDSAYLQFRLHYQWHPVNAHQPVNLIQENGSFMRISRYFPIIGYNAAIELEDSLERIQYGLGPATQLKKLEAPKDNGEDFIGLDMVVSTSAQEQVIGTGKLLKQWEQEGRNYFQFHAEKIPFRFALSSASYAVSKTVHSGIPIQVYHHPLHHENVAALISQTKKSLDYCLQYFGTYPFQQITYAEIPSFVQGFNATAYPGVIFMNEGMAFHSNLQAEPDNDVIMELAAHELSHYWWGNNQLSPDDREGASMLTESLAMYTEMMLYKQQYGAVKMKARLALHEQIYQAEKGYFKPAPLYKVSPGATHLAYSKGALVMVKLSELLGEEKLNHFLKEFLERYKYPHRATTLDFLELLKSRVPATMQQHILSLFTSMD